MNTSSEQMETLKELIADFNFRHDELKEIAAEYSAKIKALQDQYQEVAEPDKEKEKMLFEKVIRRLVTEYGTLQEDGSYLVTFKHDLQNRTADFEIFESYYGEYKKCPFVVTEIKQEVNFKEGAYLHGLIVTGYTRFSAGSGHTFSHQINHLNCIMNHRFEFLNRMFGLLTNKDHNEDNKEQDSK